MAPHAARRLAEQVVLGRRVLSIELLLAAQACDLRGEPLAPGTARARALVRDRAPFVAAGQPLPDLEPLVELVAGGGLLA
jgi:histidine ammonia-lyase